MVLATERLLAFSVSRISLVLSLTHLLSTISFTIAS